MSLWSLRIFDVFIWRVDAPTWKKSLKELTLGYILMENYQIVYKKIILTCIIYAGSQLPTNWFDTWVFLLFTFEYVEFVCCLVLNNYMINASESFDNMNLNMKSTGKRTYI
jgi:hypothetical protein